LTSHTHQSPPLSYFLLSFFFFTRPRPPTSTLFPYTTLFRSHSSGTWVGCWPDGRGSSGRASCSAAMPTPMKLFCSGGAQLLNTIDRKSTRLNSSHLGISYAVFCLKKKKKKTKKLNS